MRPTSMHGRARRIAPWLTIFLAAATAIACTTGSGGQAHGPGPISPVLRARAICQRHFAHVEQAMLTTIAGLTNVGPRPVDPPSGPLGKYEPGDAVALCLVRDGPGKYIAVAVVLASGRAYARWTQNIGSQFSFPS